MKTHLRLPLVAFLTALFSFAFTADGWGQYIVDFEGAGETKTGYASGTVNLSGLDWDMTEALIGTDANDFKNGARSARMRGYGASSMTMLQDKANGIGSISFVYSRYGTDIQVDWMVEYSTDGGLNWIQIGSDFTPTATNDVQNFSENVNVSGNVRVRIKRATETGAANRRMNIDDIIITDYIASTPTLSATPSTLTNFDYIVGSGPSASQSFDASGLNLDPAAGNISVTAPADFEVSTDDVTFSSSVNLPYTLGELSATTVYVRLAAGLGVNTYSGNVTVSGGTATDATVAVSGEVNPVPVPTLTANPTSLSGLNYMVGSGPSSPQTFVLSGTDLDGSNVNLSVPAQFELSTDNTTYSGSLMLPAYTGSNTTIYVRLAAGLAENNYTGDVDISGGGAADIDVSLDGNVTPFIDPYTGTGVFELVTSLAELEDGYYVVVNSGNTVAMSNDHNGTFLAPVAVTLAGNTIVNPGSDIVWLIRADGNGYTMYNEVDDIYVSQTLNTNSVQISSSVTGNAERWDFQYPTSEFVVTNLNQTTRILRYNPGAPRFASYTSGQQDLLLYKWIEVNDPVLTAIPTDIDGLNYSEGFGPSDAQTFEVSGLNLDNSDVTVSVDVNADFELSSDDVTYSNSITLTAFDGTATTIYARLKAGLAAGAYDDDVAIAGGGALAISVSLEGNVIEPFDLPYNNPLRTQAEFDQAVLDGFDMSEVVWGGTTGGGYTRIPNLSKIISPQIDLSNYDLMIVSFALTTFNGNTGQELTVFVSNDNGLNYTALDSFSVPASYQTFTQYIDVSALNGSQGRIKFEMTDGANQIRFRDLDMDFFEGYFHMDAAWFPANPDGLNIPADDVLVVNGDVAFNSNTTINALTINEGASMDVAAVLTANGDITNNGSLVFVSNATTTGQLDTFAGAVSGDVTVQRYIPARRAFRLLSSAVTTSGSIRDNWQEGVNNPDLVTNLNPHPGFGTHITGSVTGDNGFDATPSGNPSLFTLNNATQLWEDVDNTDINTIAAGAPYRLMVRGDRSIDVTDNTATPTNTVLRTTGALHTGTFATTGFNENAGAFNFFGNPYPAIVAMNDVLAAATNVNDAHYYIWDPNLGTRGAYVTVDLPLGTNASGSAANEYLQPGQAGFVTTLANGPASLSFEESHKAVTQPMTQVFSIVSKIDLRLYTASAFAQSEKASDAVRIKFSEDYTNAVTPMDAAKFDNLDENLATNNDGSLLSIEARDLPVAGETIPLYTDQYRTTDYVFEAHLSDVEDIVILLADHYTGTFTELINNDVTVYAFQVDASISASVADDRFEIVFEEMMGTNDAQFGDGFVLFPNPAQGEINIATRGIAGEEVQLSITGILGQTVYNKKMTVNANGLLTLDTSALSNGVYILKLNNAGGGQYITKFIKR